MQWNGEDKAMFDGFSQVVIDIQGIPINVVYGGNGPPILLLHGYPQTHVMWHKVASALADSYTVVAPDLRGYGDSGKPDANGDDNVYCKRSTAADQVQVMLQLRHELFHVIGDDRGTRVGHRMALD